MLVEGENSVLLEGRRITQMCSFMRLADSYLFLYITSAHNYNYYYFQSINYLGV